MTAKTREDPLKEVKFTPSSDPVEEDEEEETRCGFGPFQGDWLQRFANKKTYILVYGVIGTFQSMFFTYFVAVLTTIEKQFKLNSATSGVVLSGNEVSQILLSLLLAYYGGQGHRPRLLGFGMLCSSLSCFVVIVPHLFYGSDLEIRLNMTVSLNSTASQLCSDSLLLQKDCREVDYSGSVFPATMLFLSQFVSGIGSTMFYTLGMPYLDDNAEKKQTPMLFGIIFSLRLFGPTLGFTVASGCLKMYVNISEKPLFGTTDPRWIGAWWLGFVIVGLLLIPAALLISCFPRRLPKPKQTQGSLAAYRQISQQSSNVDGPTTKPNAKEDGPKIKDFPVALKLLLTNKALMWNYVSSIAAIFAISGYLTFLPKYMQAQFQQTAVMASVVNGTVGIFTMALGFLLGGWLISKVQPRAVYVQGYNTVSSFLYAAAYFAFAFVGCQLKPLHGLQNLDGTINPMTECNTNCNCAGVRYSPVCSADGQLNFFSACHAGCKESIIGINGTKEYNDCSCLAFGNQTTDTWLLGTAKEGVCDSGCTTPFYIYLAAMGILKFFSATSRVGGTVIELRCVKPNEKAFAMGLATFLLSVFAFIPSPILYGALIDKTCILWHTDQCGKQGHCWLYDPERMRMVLHLLTAGCFFIAAVADGIACIYVKDLDLYAEEADENTIQSPDTRTPPLTPVEEAEELSADPYDEKE